MCSNEKFDRKVLFRVVICCYNYNYNICNLSKINNLNVFSLRFKNYLKIVL